MAEEFDDKTEAPTPRRREEARERGQFARSADLTAAVLLLGFLLLLNGFGPGLISAMRDLLSTALSVESMGSGRTSELSLSIRQAVTRVAGAAAPILIGSVVIAVLMNLLQVGFFFSLNRLAPNFGLINPLRGFAKLFRADNWVHLFVNLLKIALVGAVAWSAIRGRVDAIISGQEMGPAELLAHGAGLVYFVALRIAILLLVLAVADYAYQRFRNERELRMTKQEVKEEMRHMDGDPRLRQRRRQVALQMHQRRLKRDVPTADVIVTNPTEFAVALKYDSAKMRAPKVIAKGRDLIAQRIREIAIESGVPIVERPPLARALYRLVEVGKEIPEEFYSAVAEILAYVYELTGRKTKEMQAA